jgi:hypothetical protein
MGGIGVDKWVLKWVGEKFGWRKKGKEDFYEDTKFIQRIPN